MFGIGYEFFVLFAWSFLGPIAWGLLSALLLAKHSRRLAWFAGFFSAGSVVIPLVAAVVESWVSAGAAALVVAVVSLPLFVVIIFGKAMVLLYRGNLFQSKANALGISKVPGSD